MRFLHFGQSTMWPVASADSRASVSAKAFELNFVPQNPHSTNNSLIRAIYSPPRSPAQCNRRVHQMADYTGPRRYFTKTERESATEVPVRVSYRFESKMRA